MREKCYLLFEWPLKVKLQNYYRAIKEDADSSSTNDQIFNIIWAVPDEPNKDPETEIPVVYRRKNYDIIQGKQVT